MYVAFRDTELRPKREWVHVGAWGGGCLLGDHAIFEGSGRALFGAL